MKISNDVFSKIFNYYEKDVENLYKEESACLVIFRILPEICQHTLVRLINIDNAVNIKRQDLKYQWADIMEDCSNDIRKCIFILFSIKIITDKNIIIINEDFKKNMLKIIKHGLTTRTNLLLKKKNKSWSECFQNGIKALEKYLLNIMDLDGMYSRIESDKIKLLINSGLVKKEDQNYYKLAPIALQGMLDNRIMQIRLLMIKYINSFGETEDRQKFLNFINFLFEISTLDVGAVNLYNL
jgi:hypothetical protein